ncbi:protein tramtrack, alpha isoform-like isoform X2 [Malaya genurostris]|uniref:protein tramtrack, alpha isoform-like isoform X2 n=1 Tax=Malaya genurostris TaxID=325434 RepID=UPI0026F40512|nr:protein tramtrack, alpha isoform-like isoform X2 [Malaya genurostris]
MSSGQSQQFCVRWNSHLGSIGAAFPQLLAGQRFVDVTLACEGHQVHCHRLVLAACSTFFENLLGENPCKHPIIILPREIKLWAIQALVDFMYKGEVNVSQAGLPDLMKCAEILKIRGLCGSDAALNLNHINSPARNTATGSTSLAGAGQPNDTSNHSGQRESSPQRAEHGKMQQNSALSGTKIGGNLLHSLNLQPVASSTPAKTSSQQRLQERKSHSFQHSGDDGENSDNGGSGNEMCIKTEDLIIDEDAGKGDDEEDLELVGCDKNQAEDDDAVEDEDIEDFIEDVDQDLRPLDERTQERHEMYNRNTMDIYVKPKRGIGGASTASNPDISLEEAGSELSTDGYENIICSPNFPQLGGSTMGSYQDDDYDDFDIQILPDDSSMTNGDSDGGGDDELVYPPPLLPFGNSETSITRVPSTKGRTRTNGGPGLLPTRRYGRQSSGRGGSSRLLSRLTRESSDVKIPLANGVAIPPSAFVLRNPRGNQPRSYNTDALWSALMDVKAGESIYRASQIHKVPRKTLRNWMKRWDIKSAYPMPRQLKEAAEKKRIIKELTEQAQHLSDEPIP